MSKQNVGKSRSEARTAPGNGRTQARANAANSARKGSNSGSPTIPIPPQRAARTAGAQTRPVAGKQAQAARSKRGFRLRPLDVALLIAGVLVVGFIVFSAFQVPPEAIDPSASVPPENAQHVPVGQLAPDFSLHDIDGVNYTLSNLKGKVVVLEFMATWCPHCQNDAPIFNHLNETYKDKGVQVLSINATTKDHDKNGPATVNDLKWFRDNYAVKHPMLFDKTLKSANDYGVRGFPTIYVVDKEGKIAFTPPEDSIPGYDELAAKVDELLKQ
jgi:peroxiredoxin